MLLLHFISTLDYSYSKTCAPFPNYISVFRRLILHVYSPLHATVTFHSLFAAAGFGCYTKMSTIEEVFSPHLRFVNFLEDKSCTPAAKDSCMYSVLSS